MSWWYEQLGGSLVCGVLASLTWVLMVGMGKQILVADWGWLQGFALLTFGNGLLWFFLVLLEASWLFWLTLFFALNSALGYWLTHLPHIHIPPPWARIIHPLGITAMVTLLGGATAKF